MKFIKRIKWLTVGGYLYLFYALSDISGANNWFEFVKSLVTLAIAIVAFVAIILSDAELDL